MKYISLTGLTLALVLVPSLAEASASIRLNNYGANSVDRPTVRSIENSARNRWDNQEMLYRRFMRQLQRIEEKKDEIAPEVSADPAPNYDNNPQDFTPYHWIKRRRHVRHQYWDSYYQRGTQAHFGQGLLGQPGLVEEEAHRNDIEVDAGGR